MGYPWLCDGDVVCPDSEIVAAVEDNGLDTQDLESL